MKIFTHLEFNRGCVMLWGERFKPSAAKALRKGIRTIERYSANEAPIPAEVRQAMARMAAIRSDDLSNYAGDYLA